MGHKYSREMVELGMGHKDQIRRSINYLTGDLNSLLFYSCL